VDSITICVHTDLSLCMINSKQCRCIATSRHTTACPPSCAGETRPLTHSHTNSALPLHIYVDDSGHCRKLAVRPSCIHAHGRHFDLHSLLGPA